jgi:hypothetical protein
MVLETCPEFSAASDLCFIPGSLEYHRALSVQIRYLSERKPPEYSMGRLIKAPYRQCLRTFSDLLKIRVSVVRFRPSPRSKQIFEAKSCVGRIGSRSNPNAGVQYFGPLFV